MPHLVLNLKTSFERNSTDYTSWDVGQADRKLLLACKVPTDKLKIMNGPEFIAVIDKEKKLISHFLNYM